MPDWVNEDEAYQNAKMPSDRQNARVEHDAALKRQITAALRDNTELYRKYTEDQVFQEDLKRDDLQADLPTIEIGNTLRQRRPELEFEPT